MTQAQMILYAIKLVFGGFAAFFAIILWSKTKDCAWMCMVAAIVIRYAGIVYDMLTQLSVVLPIGIQMYHINITTIAFTVIPDLLFIIAFSLMLHRSSRF